MNKILKNRLYHYQNIVTLFQPAGQETKAPYKRIEKKLEFFFCYIDGFSCLCNTDNNKTNRVSNKITREISRFYHVLKRYFVQKSILSYQLSCENDMSLNFY